MRFWVAMSLLLAPGAEGTGEGGTGAGEGDPSKGAADAGQGQGGKEGEGKAELSPLEKALKAERETNKQLRDEVKGLKSTTEAERLKSMTAEDQAKHYKSQAESLQREKDIRGVVKKVTETLGDKFTVNVSRIEDLAIKGNLDEESISGLVEELKKPAVGKDVSKDGQKRVEGKDPNAADRFKNFDASRATLSQWVELREADPALYDQKQAEARAHKR